MKLLSADFVTSAAVLRQARDRSEHGRGTAGPGKALDGIPYDGLAQVALAGRSNVGKSSLINALSRVKVARTSAAPGKTRLANVYRIGAEGGAGGPGRWSVYFVDLPGYGYARGGASSADELGAVAEGYFRGAEDGSRRAAFLLVDSRHPELESDIAAARWLDGLHVTRHVVATKIDKLSRTERARNLRIIENVFGTAAVPVSVTSGEGLDVLWTMIAKIARRVEPLE